MLQKLDPDSVKLNARVTRVAWGPEIPVELPMGPEELPNLPEDLPNFPELKPPTLEVTYRTSNGITKCQTYDHVILTTTITNLRAIDLDNAGLTIPQHMAIRQLQYGPATKFGVKFKTAWWGEEGPHQPQFGAIKGGISNTDRTVRKVVYPPHDSKSTVLLCAHAWTNDALQLIPLLNEESQDIVKDIICRDLVAIHGLDPVTGYTFLHDEQWVKAFGFSWTNDPTTTGASSLCLIIFCWVSRPQHGHRRFWPFRTWSI